MRNSIIVSKIIEYIDKILSYTYGCNQHDFNENTMLIEACVFNLSQIGELANKFDDDFKESHSEIPWIGIIGLRNKIVHDYEGVILLLIWDIINNDLAQFKEQLEQL